MPKLMGKLCGENYIGRRDLINKVSAARRVGSMVRCDQQRHGHRKLSGSQQIELNSPGDVPRQQNTRLKNR
jgi:hypothetical protein